MMISGESFCQYHFNIRPANFIVVIFGSFVFLLLLLGSNYPPNMITIQKIPLPSPLDFHLEMSGNQTLFISLNVFVFLSVGVY